MAGFIHVARSICHIHCASYGQRTTHTIPTEKRDLCSILFRLYCRGWFIVSDSVQVTHNNRGNIHLMINMISIEPKRRIGPNYWPSPPLPTTMTFLCALAHKMHSIGKSITINQLDCVCVCVSSIDSLVLSRWPRLSLFLHDPIASFFGLLATIQSELIIIFSQLDNSSHRWCIYSIFRVCRRYNYAAYVSSIDLFVWQKVFQVITISIDLMVRFSSDQNWCGHNMWIYDMMQSHEITWCDLSPSFIITDSY